MEIIEKAMREGRTLLSEYESKQVLAAYRIPVTREVLIERREDLPQAAHEIGYPLVLKGCSPEISHKTEKGLRDYAIMLALTDTGLRASEFVSLRVSSVDMRTGLITVIGKGRKQRTVRVGAKARKSILRYLGTRPDVIPDSPLWVAYGFDGAERGPLTLRGLQIVLRRLGERAGVTPCSPHKFRRTLHSGA